MPYAPVLNPYPAQYIAQGFGAITDAIDKQREMQMRQQQLAQQQQIAEMQNATTQRGQDFTYGSGLENRAQEYYGMNLKGSLNTMPGPMGSTVLQNPGTGQFQVMQPQVAGSDLGIPVRDPEGNLLGHKVVIDGKETFKAASPEDKQKQLPETAVTKLANIQQIQNALPGLKAAWDVAHAENATGPILGRTLGKNPYSPAAQNLNSMVQQLTPGLARGVFGEVGVLTDKDVERYSKMLPAATHSPEVAARLYNSLADRLDNAIQTNLQANKDAGYNTGAFEKQLTKRTPRWQELGGAAGPAAATQPAGPSGAQVPAPSSRVRMIDPSGRIGTLPAAQVDAAIAKGFRRAP